MSKNDKLKFVKRLEDHWKSEDEDTRSMLMATSLALISNRSSTVSSFTWKILSSITGLTIESIEDEVDYYRKALLDKNEVESMFLALGLSQIMEDGGEGEKEVEKMMEELKKLKDSVA